MAIFLRRLLEGLAEDWTLDAMAEECGLSRTRFADLCRQLTNHRGSKPKIDTPRSRSLKTRGRFTGAKAREAQSGFSQR